MGRKRKPEHVKKTTVFVNVPNPIYWHLEEIGKPHEVINAILLEKYSHILEKYREKD